MRVLLVNSVCGRQSTGRIVAEIKKIIIEQGNECRIAYGEKNSIADDDDYLIGSEFDRYIHAAYARLFDASGLGSRKATENFIEWIIEYNPDIIHLHNIHGYYINIEVLFNFLKKCNKKIVWTLHDCWSFTGHCAYFDYTNCSKWSSMCEDCKQRTEYPSRLFIDCSARNYLFKKKLFSDVPNMTIVSPSQWLADLVKESFLKRYQTLVINNGINTDVFFPRAEPFKFYKDIKNKKIILGVAAVWDRRKGLPAFIQLSHMLDDNYRIILVGLTKKQIKQLPKEIIGIARTDSAEELARLYSAAYVFVNPTLEDNYPTTNLESIACGTPVITYRTGGSPEVINGNTGAVVEKHDVEGLVNQIRQLNIDRNKCASEGIKFCANDRYKEYYKLYLSLYKI